MHIGLLCRPSRTDKLGLIQFEIECACYLKSLFYSLAEAKGCYERRTITDRINNNRREAL